MVYWIVVLLLWMTSLVLTFTSGIFAYQYLKTSDTTALTVMFITFGLGFILSFLVVNWPTGGTTKVVKKGLDERTVEALKVMAKTVTVAPRAVKEGLEKIVEKYAS